VNTSAQKTHHTAPRQDQQKKEDLKEKIKLRSKTIFCVFFPLMNRRKKDQSRALRCFLLAPQKTSTTCLMIAFKIFFLRLCVLFDVKVSAKKRVVKEKIS
jgi:hypothetical protein